MTSEIKNVPMNRPPLTRKYYAPPGWMDHWQPNHPVPVTEEQFAEAMERMDEAMKRPEPEEVAIAIRRIMEFLLAFGLAPPAESREIVIRAYKAIIEQTPADLVPVMVERVTMGLRYHKTPLPGDLEAAVAPEIERRNHTRLKADLLLMVTGW